MLKKSSISSSKSKALNTSPKVNKDDDGKFEKEYEELEKKRERLLNLVWFVFHLALEKIVF